MRPAAEREPPARSAVTAGGRAGRLGAVARLEGAEGRAVAAGEAAARAAWVKGAVRAGWTSAILWGWAVGAGAGGRKGCACTASSGWAVAAKAEVAAVAAVAAAAAVEVVEVAVAVSFKTMSRPTRTRLR